jgi:catecholate siderophore receptor
MKFRMTPVAAMLTAMFAVPSVAMAQDAPAKTEEAVKLPAVKVIGQQDTPKAEQVSSPKFTETLLNTTQTITVIKKEVLQQQAATSLTEAMRNVPGITFTAGENGNTSSGDTVFMRGFDTQGSIYLDNIRDLSAAVRDVFNVEQIEIVKGPAGADNGRAATSGYINLSSKLPQADDFVAGTVSYGSAEKRRATADINQQIGSTSAVRLNLMGQDGGVAGRDFLERESWGIAPSIAFGLGTSTRAYLFSQHVRQNNIPDGLVPTAGLDGYRFAAAVQEELDDNGVRVKPVDSENFYGSKDDYEDIEANMYTAKLEHDLSPTSTIRNLTRYGKSEQERLLTAPNGAPQVTTTPAAPFTLRTPDEYDVNRGRHGSFRTNEILTNQTSITTGFDTAGLKHSLVAGMEYIDESQDTPTKALASATPFRTNFYNPDRNAAVPGIITTGFSEGETQTEAAYLIDTVKLNEQWSVNGSLRYEHYRTKTTTVTGLNATPTTVKLKDSGNLLSWKAGILFKPAPNGSLYASAANSMRPPGGDNFTLNASPTNISNPDLDPQEATNMEVGAKWDFLEGKLATTIAFFSTENKNDLAEDVDGEIRQYGEKQVEGVELGAVGLINSNWTISAGLTRQNTRVTEGTATQTNAPINWSPRLTANLWTTYKIAPLKLTLGGGGRYVQSQVRQINNNPSPATAGLFEVESYTVFDAMASFEATKNLTLQFNAYNLFDKDYIQSLNNSGQRYKPGEPLSYLASVIVRY